MAAVVAVSRARTARIGDCLNSVVVVVVPGRVVSRSAVVWIDLLLWCVLSFQEAITVEAHRRVVIDAACVRALILPLERDLIARVIGIRSCGVNRGIPVQDFSLVG